MIKIIKAPCAMCGKKFEVGDKIFTNPSDGELDPQNPKLYCLECVESGQVGIPKQ